MHEARLAARQREAADALERLSRASIRDREMLIQRESDQAAAQQHDSAVDQSHAVMSVVEQSRALRSRRRTPRHSGLKTGREDTHIKARPVGAWVNAPPAPDDLLAFSSRLDRHSPRQVRHLDYIS